MIAEEDGYRELLGTVAASSASIGAPTLLETAMVLISRQGAAGVPALPRFLERQLVAPVAFDARHAEAAARAFVRYGKGRHPAGLNFGDCMAYAMAKVADAPLLFVGDDFARTDVEAAL